MIRSAESFGQILPAVPESAIINFVSLFPSSAQQTEAKKHLHTGCVVMKGGRGKGEWGKWGTPLAIKSNLHAKEMAELSRVSPQH